MVIEKKSEGTNLNNEFNLIKVSYRQLESVFKDNPDMQILVDFLYKSK